MTHETMPDELVEECILFWDDHVKGLAHAGNVSPDLFAAIIDPPLNSTSEGTATSGFLAGDGEYPLKSTLAERCEWDPSTISNQPDIGKPDQFQGVTSLWEAFRQVGLINWYRTPKGHRVYRNEVAREFIHGDRLRRNGIPDPTDDAIATEQQKRVLTEHRLMTSRFGLNLLHRYKPEVLQNYPPDAYPSAYIGASPREVLMGVKAEHQLSVTLDDIEVEVAFEPDPHRSSASTNYWQLVLNVRLTVSDASPLRDVPQIEFYLRQESNRVLQTAIDVDDFTRCTCASIEDHNLIAYEQMVLGGQHLSDSAVTEAEEPTDDEGIKCTLAPTQTPQLETNWTEGKVELHQTWDGITAGGS